MSISQMKNTEHSVWLSMIIPIYNAEKYLGQCIESVLSQSYPDFELILVDDGSRDSSGQICRRFAERDSRIRYFHKENGGSLSARRYGIKHARGEYIGFMDADDYLIGDHVFQSLYQSAAEYDCDLVQFGYVKKYNHLKKTAKTVNGAQYALEEEFRRREYPLLLCSFWDQSRLTTNVWNKLYRRSLMVGMAELKEEEKVFWGDDLIMNLYLLKNCRSALFLSEAFYTYRQFSGGTSRLSRREMQDLDIIKKHQLHALENWTGEDKDRIEAILYSELAGWFFAYIKNCIGQIEKDELLRMIEEILEYAAFKKARGYYLQHPNENWEAIQLLVAGDAQQYIQKAEEGRRKPDMKKRLIAVLKRVYYRI